jgi:hypothetical protein
VHGVQPEGVLQVSLDNCVIVCCTWITRLPLSGVRFYAICYSTCKELHTAELINPW